MEFWDKTFEDNFTVYKVSTEKNNETKGLYSWLNKFYSLIGNVKGKNILDIGCGNGDTSVKLALLGAKVTAIDTSNTAIRNTYELAKYNDVISSVEIIQMNAMEINTISQSFDLVTGSFILHHIEPFNKFVEILTPIIRDGGRAVFLENSARNKILIFFRQFTGKFGIPKYGDEEEFPFQPVEIDMLRIKFDKIILHYPCFRFFVMASPYLFKKNKIIKSLSSKLDDLVYKNLPFLNKYSYIQIIEIYK